VSEFGRGASPHVRRINLVTQQTDGSRDSWTIGGRAAPKKARSFVFGAFPVEEPRRMVSGGSDGDSK
jgi:hypothetical protein